jgi:hypothetical protein
MHLSFHAARVRLCSCVALLRLVGKLFEVRLHAVKFRAHNHARCVCVFGF